MDTPTALNTLNSFKNNLSSSISGVQAQQEAIEVAVAQLQDLLDTPPADVKAAQDALAVEQEAHSADNEERDTQIITLTQQLTTEQKAHATDNTTNLATIQNLADQVAALTAEMPPAPTPVEVSPTDAPMEDVVS